MRLCLDLSNANVNASIADIVLIRIINKSFYGRLDAEDLLQVSCCLHIEK